MIFKSKICIQQFSIDIYIKFNYAIKKDQGQPRINKADWFLIHNALY